jgi:cytochrome oxidase assembly protein ShyY1
VKAAPSERQRPAGVIGPGIAALALFAVLVGLGKWQLDRKVWKETLIATLTERLAVPPSALPSRERWNSLDQAADEYRRVRFTAELPAGEAALVFTSGSAFRPDVSGPGYWIFAPARLSDGGVVVVNRGFVPEGEQNKATSLDEGGRASLDMVGTMRWPEQSAWFMPAADPAHNMWFVRDPIAIARAKNWGEVAPFFVEVESPVPAGGLPIPGPLKVNLPDDHLQYAITWFGLATVVAISFGFWLRSSFRVPAAS